MKQCYFCKKNNFIKKFEYFTPPKGETKYFININKYYRYYLQCNYCNHYFSISEIKLKNHYSSKYNEATYSGNLKKNFEKIKNLPHNKSDNYFRVMRVADFVNREIRKIKKKTLLDVGSGLGIFPYAISDKHFICTALDPDKLSCLHLKNNLKINAIHGDFLKKRIKNKYDVITFNKVIEHVKKPEKMLLRAKSILKKNGIIYIEVPDVLAGKKGKNREEFHIDHLHVFSKKSLFFLAKNINLNLKKVKSIREPSGKFTIYAFLTK
jgi:2-polyprenyl-3-methyl-5-hydroxy-6-metoxy-1,4-benzoquinol methylase